jgi:tetratricopeptide (TPR) repeat protein/predicted Ser/Thr protein kinase
MLLDSASPTLAMIIVYASQNIARIVLEKRRYARLNRELSMEITQIRERLSQIGTASEIAAKKEELPEYADSAFVTRFLPAHFDKIEFIGQGGMGVVYKAVDKNRGHPVALKVLSPLVQDNRTAVTRFLQEARVMQKLSHPGLVEVYEVGKHVLSYFTMEYVDGEPLDLHLDTNPNKKIRARLDIILQTAEVLGYMHSKGIIHRDLKPSNILVTAAGEPKVGDFGLAHLVDSTEKLTRTGAVLGTPLYMAPEQVEGRSQDITPRTDVYALGAILYEVLTARPPHTGESAMEICRKIVHDAPAAPHLSNPKASGDLETIVLKALDKDPAGRYATAEAFAEDLRRHLSGEPVEARRANTAYRFYKRVRRNPLQYALVASAALALLVAVGVGILASERAKRIEAERDLERDSAVKTMQEAARMALDAALQLRRKGATQEEMRPFLETLQRAYHNAIQRVAHVAEVDYLMGRMHRVILEDDQALEFQERSLRKDPEYAPALYERAILKSREYGSGGHGLAEAWETLRSGVPDTRPAPAGDQPLNEAERLRPELIPLRKGIVRDITNLLRLLRGGSTGAGPARITEANARAAQGILAYHQGDYPEARAVLAEVVQAEPLLEEAWETLAQALHEQLKRAKGIDENLRVLRELEESLTKALRHDRGYRAHWFNRGFVRTKIGQWEDERDADPLPMYAAAEGDFVESLRLNPRFADGWFWRGIARAKCGDFRWRHRQDPLGDYSEAERSIREASRLRNGHVDSWLALGMTLANRGHYRAGSGEDPGSDYAEAEKCFSELLRLKKDYLPALAHRADLRRHQGNRRMESGKDPLADFASAEEDLTEALSIQKTYTEAWTQRGTVRLSKARYWEAAGQKGPAWRDYAEAARDFRQALQLDPALERQVAELLREAEKKSAPPEE